MKADMQLREDTIKKWKVKSEKWKVRREKKKEETELIKTNKRRGQSRR